MVTPAAAGTVAAVAAPPPQVTPVLPSVSTGRPQGGDGAQVQTQQRQQQQQRRRPRSPLPGNPTAQSLNATPSSTAAAQAVPSALGSSCAPTPGPQQLQQQVLPDVEMTDADIIIETPQLLTPAAAPAIHVS